MRRTSTASPKEAEAIAYLDQVVSTTNVVPLKTDIARAIGVSTEGTLYRMPKFKGAYRAALRHAKKKPRRTYRVANENAAIAFLNDMVATTGRVPPKTEIARAVGVERKTMTRWPRFCGAFDAALTRATRKQKGGKRAILGLEERAIQLLNELIETTGFLPSIREIARALHVDHKTLSRQSRFIALRAAAASRAKAKPAFPTRPKTKLDELKGEAAKQQAQTPAAATVGAPQAEPPAPTSPPSAIHVVPEAKKGHPTKRPCYARDHLWLEWYNTEGKPTHQNYGAIRDQWNQMGDIERQPYPPAGKIPKGKPGWDRVRKAIAQAQKERAAQVES